MLAVLTNRSKEMERQTTEESRSSQVPLQPLSMSSSSLRWSSPFNQRHEPNLKATIRGFCSLRDGAGRIWDLKGIRKWRRIRPRCHHTPVHHTLFFLSGDRSSKLRRNTMKMQVFVPCASFNYCQNCQIDQAKGAEQIHLPRQKNPIVSITNHMLPKPLSSHSNHDLDYFSGIGWFKS